MTRPGVRIAGVGQTRPLREDPRAIPEMVLEAVEAALADAGLDLEDVDAAVTASVDLFDGLTASNVAITEVVGAVMKPETRIAGDGLAAVMHAACQIEAGAYRTVLVVAHAKPSLVWPRSVTAWAMDPVLLQPLGVDFLVCAGLQASMRAGPDPAAAVARWCRIAATRRAAALQAVGELGVSAADLEARFRVSPVLAHPLLADLAAPAADLACAAVLRREGAGREPGVKLLGCGLDLSPHAPGDRDLARPDGLHRAYRRARAQAGLTRRARRFDLLEPACVFPHEEELFCEAVSAGPADLISPGGGLYSGANPVAAGLSRLVAATRWLRGRRAGLALAHGSWGPAGQAHALAVLEAVA